MSASVRTSQNVEWTTQQDQLLARIRDDFPILDEQVNDMPLVYLDNAATSQKPRQVLDRIQTYYETENSNVHRGVHALSQRATESYEAARETVRTFIGAESINEVIFTKGTTEAINLVAQSFLRPRLNADSEILLTMMEHHSNIVPWQLLEDELGARIVVANIYKDGSLDIDDLVSKLTPNTALLAIAHVSNSLGTINPVRELIRKAHAENIPVLVDGAQAVPHMAVDVLELDCDFYTFSGHKMFGPTGIGVLYGKEELLDNMPPYQAGGDMIESVSFSGTRFNKLPHKFEAGTPHIAGAIGLAEAIHYINSIGYEFISLHEERLLQATRRKLSEVDGMRFIGDAEYKASVVSFLLGDSHPYDVGTILDKMGVAVRTGHHCTEPLMQFYKIPGTVRASFALYNSLEEIDRLVEAINRANTLLN